MPEGHAIHRLAGQLAELSGRRLTACSPQGRFADGAATLDGRTLQSAEAFGKHLLLDFDGIHLHIHLGLAGTIFSTTPTTPPLAGLRLRLESPSAQAAWNFLAPNRCELLDDDQRADLLARLGPDPIRGGDPTWAFGRISASRRAIGQLLMDQRVIAGVGNIFRAEALNKCRIHPSRPGLMITEAELACLWSTLTADMRRGVDEGRIITVDTPPGIDRAGIEPSEGRYVYKQEHCRRCGEKVRSWTMAARTVYACEHCQRPVV